MTELKLFNYTFYDGRAGRIDGLIATNLDEINELSGEEVYFGEVLGKHSEVYGTIDPEDFREVPVSPGTVAELVAAQGRTISGYNPFEYLAEEE